MPIKPKKIEDMLKGLGFLKAAEIKEGLSIQRETKERLGRILLVKGYINDENILDLVLVQLGIGPEETKDIEIAPEVISKIPPYFAKAHRIIPIRFYKNTVTIATDNPFNFLAFENFSEFLGFRIEGVLSSAKDVGDLLEKYYPSEEGQQPVSRIISNIPGDDQDAAADLIKQRDIPKLKPDDDAPVVRLVSLLIGEAVKKRSSDIHIEPLENKLRIRYRIDGILYEVPGPPKKLQSSVISRVKIMAKMDIAEKRLPQDGRIRISAAGRDLDLRVSTLPAIYGESVVLRILDKSSFIMGLKDLGFSDTDEKKFEKLLKMPNGILLVTGPTGSGKTTTLYASLNYINKPDRKLITIEDPVEYQMTGINQVQVRPQINLTFAAGLRSILRQSPDVIMIGEIRDPETAQIAIQASLTGHLVFSTLHTNDAPGAITRLIDMGTKPYLVASAIQAIIAQRLVRSICPSCKEKYEPSREELKIIKLSSGYSRSIDFYKGKGCEDCAGTGYSGRIGIFELLFMTDKIRKLVFEKVSSGVIKENARESGMVTLREDGIKKVLKGETTISEVMRVTQQDLA
ncbi:MAG: type II secretion system ATPase GspE [Candidatus Omnitrophica bacterium]|nr:type II secretion system ATPase GspE [Candidatus Omnitrophota bacterium]